MDLLKYVFGVVLISVLAGCDQGASLSEEALTEEPAGGQVYLPTQEIILESEGVRFAIPANSFEVPVSATVASSAVDEASLEGVVSAISTKRIKDLSTQTFYFLSVSDQSNNQVLSTAQPIEACIALPSVPTEGLKWMVVVQDLNSFEQLEVVSKGALTIDAGNACFSLNHPSVRLVLFSYLNKSIAELVAGYGLLDAAARNESILQEFSETLELRLTEGKDPVAAIAELNEGFQAGASSWIVPGDPVVLELTSQIVSQSIAKIITSSLEPAVADLAAKESISGMLGQLKSLNYSDEQIVESATSINQKTAAVYTTLAPQKPFQSIVSESITLGLGKSQVAEIKITELQTQLAIEADSPNSDSTDQGIASNDPQIDPTKVLGAQGNYLLINDDEAATADEYLRVSLTLNAPKATQMYITSIPGCESGGRWESYLPAKDWTLKNENKENTVYVVFQDTYGNTSDCLQDSIIHDRAPPSPASISIDAGAAATGSTAVVLSLDAVGATDVYVTNTQGCTSGGLWEKSASNKTKAWTLTDANQVNTVYAKFKDSLGNETECLEDAILHDSLAPASLSLSIAGGASLTASNQVDLTLTAQDVSPISMYITNTAGCTAGGDWETFAESKEDWLLSQSNQEATVYVKFRDSLGNTTSCISDAIVHDNQEPTATSIQIEGGASAVATTAVTLTLGATDASAVFVTTTADCGGTKTWEAFDSGSPTKAFTLAQTNSTATVYAQFRDSLGNESACINDTIVHDDQEPTGTSIQIEGGASAVATTAVTLTLGATGASEVYFTTTADCGGTKSWEAFSSGSPTKAATLAQTNSTATVYAQFRDEAGNESACISDTIIHDDQGITGASITISSGDTHTSSTTVSLGFGADEEPAQMFITNEDDCGGAEAWESYATGKVGHPLKDSGVDGIKTVYAKFRDALGNESNCASDTIILDANPPGDVTSLNDGTTSSGYRQTPLTTWNAASDVGGIDYYEIKVGTSSGGDEIHTATNIGNVTSYTLTNLTNQLYAQTTYYTSIRAFDLAGHTSEWVTGDGFTLDEAYTQSSFQGSETEAGDRFGSGRPDINGDYAAVGSYYPKAEAYFYKATDGGVNWTEKSIISSPGPIAGEFGAKVDIDGDYAVVSAHKENISGYSGSNNGAVYIFKTTDSGESWEPTMKDGDENPEPLLGDSDLRQFGTYISLSGDYLAVTSCTDSTNKSKVYFFKRDTGLETWSQKQVIIPASDLCSPEHKPRVKISGNRAFMLHQNGSNLATLQFFKTSDSGETWTEITAQRKNSIPNWGLAYMEVSGDLLIIGASGTSGGGAVHIYQTTDDGDTWNLLHTIVPSDLSANTNITSLGKGVDIKGNRAVIAAHESDGTEVIYVLDFLNNAANWVEAKKLSLGTTNDVYGVTMTENGSSIFAPIPFPASGGSVVHLRRQ